MLPVLAASVDNYGTVNYVVEFNCVECTNTRLLFYDLSCERMLLYTHLV